MQGKIYVKIMGGLGNQLFQYAYALKLKQLFPDKNIVIDYRYFNKTRIRRMELQELSINDVGWDNSRIPFYDISYSVYSIAVRLVGKIGKRIKSVPFLERYGYIYTYNGSEYHLPNNNLKNYYLGGYFQNEEEIRCVRNNLIKCIVPKKMTKTAEAFLQTINLKRSIGISIRVGEDYIRFGWPICSRVYYEKAVEYLLINNQNYQLVIFSDNIKKIKDEKWFDKFQIDKIHIVDCTPVESLYLLSQCNDFVIANSTFSWWGAYLGNDKQKKILAPDMFFQAVRCLMVACIFRELYIWIILMVILLILNKLN